MAQRRVSEQSFAGFAHASQGWVQSLALLTVVGLGVRDTILRVIPVGTVQSKFMCKSVPLSGRC